MRRIIVVLAVWLTAILNLTATDQAASINRGTDIVDAWRPDQHVYVKGDIGISSGQLNRLESWMDEHGKNWIILLIDRTSGEQLRDAAGRRYSGVEAVEMAANVEVRNQSDFGELNDPRSGQKNGAVFILFLAERSFSYSGGEVHEVRGLSAKNWAGDLDQPAFRAMSGGGRIADAVKGTVNEVNRRLDRQFAIERERQQREMEAAKRLISEAKSLLDQASEEVRVLETSVAAFVREYADPPGDLARPPLSDLHEQVIAATAKLEAGDAQTALSDATRVRDFVRSHAAALRDYPNAPSQFEALSQELAKISPGDGVWGRERLELATRELRLAEAAHHQAESDYALHLGNAIEATESAKGEIERGLAEQARAAEEEARLTAEKEKRERLVRVVSVAMEMLVVLGLLGLAWWLNRRRRGVKMAATRLYESWDRGVKEQTNALFSLMDRSATVVGSAASLAERGYTGETLKLSQNIIEDVDELFIMSACVRRVLDDVGHLIKPTNPLHQVFNQFFAERYERGQKRLRDQPIRFRPDEGIEPILRDERGEPERILGQLEAYEPFELSFSALIKASNHHVARATENLGIVERAWASISETLEVLQTDCDQLASRERKLSQAAEEDGFFSMPALFEVLLPESQKLLDQAVDLGATDPVGALQGPAKVARQVIDLGAKLEGVILQARKQLLPGMKSKGERLRTEGVETLWISRFLDEYSLEADALAHAAVKDDVAKRIDELEVKLNKLDERISKARMLSKSVGEIASEHIETVRKAVDGARQSLAEKLGLSLGEILSESGLNPDVYLADAVKQHSAAQVALNRGGVDAAQAALEAAREQTEEAMGILAVSQSAFENHEKGASEAKKHSEKLAASIKKQTTRLRDLQKRYLPPALRQIHEEPTTTIEDNIAEAKKELDEGKWLAETAEESFASGRLIESATLLELEREYHQTVQELLREITDHAATLKRLESENLHDFHRLEDRVEAMRSQAKDPRTMQASLDAFDEILADISALGEGLSSDIGDPIENAVVLGQISDQLSDLFKRVQADWKLHEEASRSLAAARSQLTAAEDLVRLAQTDDVTDSPQMGDLMKEVATLHEGIVKPESRLSVAHDNWNAIDTDADRILAAASRVAAALRDELKRAEDAIRSISQASKKVRQAVGWSGSHGVRVLGSPGAGSLERARQQLLEGSYLAAQRFGEDARSKAQRAVSNAETEVARRQRAEQRRREEARRMAMERARRTAASMTRSRRSSGMGGMGGIGRGGGSRMGGSTFSGGSGMGRSGW